MSSDPSDFIGWYPVHTGRQMQALAEEMGLPVTFDEELPSATVYGHCRNRPEGQGALRSSSTDNTAFWKEWERRNPK